MRRNYLWILLIGWLLIPSYLSAVVGGIEVSDAKIVSDTNGAYAEFIITSSARPVGDIEFIYTTNNGSAKSGVDYVHTSGKSVIKSGQLQTTLKVPLLKTLPTKTKDFYLTISSTKTAIFKPTGRAQINAVETNPAQQGTSHETH